MNTPLFSILVAQYNNGQYFEDCYKSIIAQTYHQWEVIIVDDSSTDDSVLVMQKIIGDDSRFKLYKNEENGGCGYTKRRLAELAQGEICAFLDPDDAITPDALKVMVEEHTKHPEASMVYSDSFWCDSSLNIDHERKSEQVENNNHSFFDFKGRIFHFLAYKKEFYNQTVGINAYLQRAVDKDLILILYEAGPALYLAQTLYRYRVHNNGISMTTNIDKAYFWYWITIIDAARRRKVNIENLFLEKALNGPKQMALQKEIDGYNRSFVFKVLRRFGVFKI